MLDLDDPPLKKGRSGKRWTIRSIANSIARAFVAFFRPRPALVVDNTPSRSPPVKPPAAKLLSKESEEHGRWYFKRDILDQLEDYFFYIRRMRKVDPGGYALFSKVGAALVPSQALAKWGDRIDPEWGNSDTAPSFGAIGMLRHGDDEEKDYDWVPVRISYFQRMNKSKATVQYHPGVTYRCVGFYDKKKLRASCEFYVAVQPDGRIVVLKEKRATKRRIKSRKKDRYGNRIGNFTLITHHWDWPSQLYPDVELRPDDYRRKISPHEKGANWFRWTVDIFTRANCDIRIRVEKDRVIGMFHVDLKRTAYFFIDREPVIIDGIKKRIFHHVRPHDRTLKDGRVTRVVEHFRGLRNFNWNGYQINITVEGLHHRNLLDLIAGGYDVEDIDDGDEEEVCGEPLISPGEVGRLLDGEINV